jgi:hypothetical protein
MPNSQLPSAQSLGNYIAMKLSLSLSRVTTRSSWMQSKPRMCSCLDFVKTLEQCWSHFLLRQFLKDPNMNSRELEQKMNKFDFQIRRSFIFNLLSDARWDMEMTPIRSTIGAFVQYWSVTAWRHEILRGISSRLRWHVYSLEINLKFQIAMIHSAHHIFNNGHPSK